MVERPDKDSSVLGYRSPNERNEVNDPTLRSLAAPAMLVFGLVLVLPIVLLLLLIGLVALLSL